MTALVDIQVEEDLSTNLATSLPSAPEVEDWANTVLQHLGEEDKEFTVRFVDNDESQHLNATYRQKNKPTNVLSFPFECPPGVPINLLGDLVVCVPVILREADEQNKLAQHHFAHMIIHGLLHLFGYDHIEDQDAKEMESLEIHILAQLGIDDPYQEL